MPRTYALPTEREVTVSTMKALVFYGPGQIELETVPMPMPRAGEAVIRVTLTTICGTDLHILRGEYPVKPGLIIGHELRAQRIPVQASTLASVDSGESTGAI